MFWNDVLANLYACDPVTAQEIEQAAPVWQKELVDVDGEQMLHTGGRGYSIRRQHLLNILAERAQGLGVHIEFEQEVTSSVQLPEADLHRGLRWGPQPHTARIRWLPDRCAPRQQQIPMAGHGQGIRRFYLALCSDEQRVAVG